MEHQSNVAYGNHYLNGYLEEIYLEQELVWNGILSSFTKAVTNGLPTILAKDQADMWIHESFTCYSETLYTESLLGKEKAQKYVIGTRRISKTTFQLLENTA
jgi:hypothetical protein